MDVARVELDESNIGRSSLSGLVTAGIWLRTDGRHFPAQGWDDFAVVILAAWADASVRLLQGDSGTARVHFMDGPYTVEITPVAPGQWRLVLVERRQSSQIEQVVTVDSAQLVESVVAASERLVGICRQKGWDTGDSMRLAASVAILRDRTERPRLDTPRLD